MRGDLSTAEWLNENRLRLATLERELAAVTAERDALEAKQDQLRTALARLHDACETGAAREWYLRDETGTRYAAKYALGLAKGGGA